LLARQRFLTLTLARRERRRRAALFLGVPLGDRRRNGHLDAGKRVLRLDGLRERPCEEAHASRWIRHRRAHGLAELAGLRRGHARAGVGESGRAALDDPGEEVAERTSGRAHRLGVCARLRSGSSGVRLDDPAELLGMAPGDLVQGPGRTRRLLRRGQFTRSFDFPARA
jgi:hypothetical protein